MFVTIVGEMGESIEDVLRKVDADQDTRDRLLCEFEKNGRELLKVWNNKLRMENELWCRHHGVYEMDKDDDILQEGYLVGEIFTTDVYHSWKLMDRIARKMLGDVHKLQQDVTAAVVLCEETVTKAKSVIEKNETGEEEKWLVSCLRKFNVDKLLLLKENVKSISEEMDACVESDFEHDVYYFCADVYECEQKIHASKQEHLDVNAENDRPHLGG